ncbi:MAG: FKBP-type peptidyl-prolyl cis-trans isomerase [Bacteroidota bacterium]
MRKIPLVICLFLGTVSSLLAQFDTKMDSISYTLGVDVGTNLSRTGLEINQEIFKKGLMDSFAGDVLSLDEDQRVALMQEFQVMVRDAKEAQQKQKSMKAKEEGKAFLAANKAKEGVVELPSGLQYKVLEAGEGSSPTTADRVEVHYEGKLIDGTVFDSSYKRGETITFGVTQVIAGWTEALQLMKPGDKWQLVIPSDLAYGDRGAGRDIPPGATLIFDVELISIP